MDDHELQEQYEYLSEKVSRLRKALAIETDIPNKFKLEQQVEESEIELIALEKKIEFVEVNKIILSLKGKANEIHCVFGNKVTIGRSLTCDFCINLDSNLISNLHSAISYISGKNEYWIEDLKSANGTYINGGKIEKPTQLNWGDKIKLGSSFLLMFEHNQNDHLSSGVFIRYDSDGEEINRYIIAPNGKLLIGSNPNEVVRFSAFRDNHSLGSLEKRVDGFYFFDVDSNEKLLDNNTELSIDFFKIGIYIPSIVPKESFEATKVLTDDSDKLKDLEEIERPSEDAKPSYLWKLNIFLVFSTLLPGLISFIFFKPDVNQITSDWGAECLKSLQNDSKFWKDSTWPPKSKLNVVFLKSSDDGIEQNFIAKLGVVEKDKPTYLSFEEYSRRFNSSQFIQLLGVGKVHERGFLQVQVTYLSPELNEPFKWGKIEFLYWHSVITLLIFASSSALIRYFLLERYRRNLQKQYEEFQKKRTEKIFEAKSQLDEARTFAQKGELAQALVIINRLLKSVSRSMPVYNEMLDLKKIILLQVQSGGGAITVSTLKKNDSISSSLNTSKLLYLRILGTPYAYQAPYGLEEIAIGRQRRKQDGSIDNIGNDVVIRVPGSDQRSLRISRRHLEIKRINAEYFVVDKSSRYTKLNGKVLSENQPYQLQSGDRLSIADVLTLEVLIRVKLTGSKANNLISIDSPNKDQDKLLIEASIGDMLTEVSHEES
jgi:pSer/pThr/pTyr-binding forkhead associated (FHA) protein